MTHIKKTLLALFSTVLLLNAYGQRIVYSVPSNDDTRRMDFEVIGKVSGNFLVFKGSRGKTFISVMNNEMEETAKVQQDYIPDDRLINLDFFAYPDFCYLIYQYQKKSIVYCNAVKIDGNGKKISDIITLDTTQIGFAANNKIYSTIISENKEHILVFKINSKNKSRFVLTTALFDKELNLKKHSRFDLPMEANNDYLDDFSVDNDGDLVFARFNRVTSETINNASLIWKAALSDTVFVIDIPQNGMLLDELTVKVDNYNKRYFLTSFYYTKRRGNIEGFYFFAWDKASRQTVLQNALALNDDLRNEAKGDASVRTAFNDYFVRNVVIKRSGGFIINTESYYTTSRTGNWNRWNYLNGPINSYDYYSIYSPYGSPYLRDRYSANTGIRYHADNITVLSFDHTGQLEWSGVVHKEQYDDESDDKISFITANTGSQLHYFFNVDERRALLLNDYTLSPDGKINHNPTLKNLDRGYEFLTKYGKQVSANQLIVPCYYRNYICFAKIEFN